MNILGEITKQCINNCYFTYDDLFTLDETNVMKILGEINNEELTELIKKFKTIKKKDIPVIDIPNIKERNINPLINEKRYN